MSRQLILEGLELPDDKTAMQMPYSHYRSLVKKNGYAPVVRALGQLAAWNVNKNKKLHDWARMIQAKLKDEFRKDESSSLIEAGFFSKLFGDKAKVTKEDEELVNGITDIVGKQLGKSLTADKSSIKLSNPEVKGSMTWEISGATPEELYDAAIEQDIPINYSNNGKSVVIVYAQRQLYISCKANKIDIDPKKINPNKRKGSIKIDNISDLIDRRRVKLDNGKIVPFTNEEEIITYKNELWLVPVSDKDNATEEYEFLDQSPMIILNRD